MKYLMPILLELTKVNPVTGDKIVRQRYVTQSEIHKYRGDFECIGVDSKTNCKKYSSTKHNCSS